jgi:gluconate kinase
VGLNISPNQLDGYIPIRVYSNEQRTFVDWCWIGPRRFTEPFFDHTIDAALRLPFSTLFRPQTSVEMLNKRYATSPGLEPQGFIFHMSRCGSTLVSQMLSSLANTLTISEAGSIDSVMRLRFVYRSLTDEDRANWLRSIVSALGQRWCGDEEHFFIKFDSWTAIDLPIIHRTFPAVPWIFLFRDPIEVMVSQLAQRGAHMVPGAIQPELFGMTIDSVHQMSPEEYCTRVLACVCQAALEHHSVCPGMMINYRELPEAVFNRIAPFYALAISDTDRETMRGVMRRDAKNPNSEFMPDSKAKRAMATEKVRTAADRWLTPVYDKLEALRGSP